MWDYAIAGSIFGLVGFFIGLNFILSWVIKKNRRSIIVLTLSFAILFSVVLILITGIKKIDNNIHHNISILALGDVC